MNRGGAESMIMNYYRNIDKQKIQFDFLVHRHEEGAFDKEILDLGGKIYRLKPINPFTPSKYYTELRSFFNKHTEYTIVHSHLNTFSCFPLKIAREYKIPFRIAHAHIAIDDFKFKYLWSGKESLKETFKKIIKFQLKKRIHKYSSHNFSCGKKAGKWLFGKDSQFTVMNNAIDANQFTYNDLVSKQYKRKYGLENKLVVGHIGRFTSQKNHSFLLKIFQNLLQKKQDCQLVLIGDGPLRETIIEEAKNLSVYDNTCFLGVQSDVPNLYQMFDVFVFPSFYEGLPVTLIEAQSAGIKVLASDTITDEVNLTNEIQFVSIKKSAAYWADKILEMYPYKKNNNYIMIKNGGYDIEANTKKYQDFCLSKLHK